MDIEFETVMGILAGLMVFYLVVLGIAVTNYILTSLALQTIAKRRKIPNPWLAWIPVANNWLIGNIADEYDERNGIKRKWRVVLLTMMLIYLVGFIVCYSILFASIFTISMQTGYGEPPSAEMIWLIVVVYIGLFAVILSALAYQSCAIICSYKIFESTVPEKSLKYMLLSLLVPLASAICLMKCRYKGYSAPVAIPEAVEFDNQGMDDRLDQLEDE